jgi:hypothetical protein
VIKAKEAREQVIKEKHAAEHRAKEQRIRREAHEKALRERGEESKIKAAREKEQDRAKKDGGLWIETSGSKKAKVRKAGGAPMTPFSAPPIMKTFPAKDKKENEGSSKTSAESGGRAGVWGPPKKILSRKENVSVDK